MRRRLLEFFNQLRAAGIPISIAESLDAAKAVAVAGVERARFREALAATLVKDEADREKFDRVFKSFYGAGAAEDSRSERRRSYGRGDGGGAKGEAAALGRVDKNDEENGGQRIAPQQDQDRRGNESDRDSDGADERREAEVHHSEARRLTLRRAAELRNFSDYSELDFEAAHDGLKYLRRRLRIRLGRRLKMAGRGRLDFRRTIRAGTQRGGTLIDLQFRARRPRHVDLLIMADVSGSVRYSSELLLGLMAGAQDFFRRVHSYAFIDRLAEASFEQGHLIMTPPLDLYARSDLGRVLTELWTHKGELLTPATLVVIMGDGRNNRLPPRADLLREINRRCRAVIWLNPERRERWGTGDSAMPLYAREVSALAACPNLQELESALARIA